MIQRLLSKRFRFIFYLLIPYVVAIIACRAIPNPQEGSVTVVAVTPDDTPTEEPTATPEDTPNEEPTATETPTTEPIATDTPEAVEPTGGELPPIGPINYAEGTCINFSVYPDNTAMGLEFVLSDIRFTASSQGVMPSVNGSDNILGLRFDEDGIRAQFPTEASFVTIRGLTYGNPLLIEALSGDDSVVARQEIQREAGLATVELLGSDIAAVNIHGGSTYESVLVELCTDFAPGMVSDVEVSIPYPPGVEPPIGDAMLVPEYPPMDQAIEELAPLLREAGVQINTARSVLLSEESASVAAGTVALQETVVLAPIGPSARELGAPVATTLVAQRIRIVGVMVLESKAPNSTLPPGNYLLAANIGEKEGVITFVDANGEIRGRSSLLSGIFERNNIRLPIAAIYLGTKYCVLGFGPWLGCFPCSFWNVSQGTSYEQCQALLEQ